MISKGVRLQLAAFITVAVVAIVYTLFRFAGLGDFVNPPYTVHAHFARSGGLTAHAEVDLLGTNVGTVEKVTVAPGGDVVASLRIDHGVQIPRKVAAAVTDKSAIGEQYVELTPHDHDGPYLTDGAKISRKHTSTPLPVQHLLGNLNSLAASVPNKDLTTDLSELAKAFGGLGPELQRTLDDTNRLTKTGLDNLHDLVGLINTSKTVLDTQVASAPQIGQLSGQLAGLTDELRRMDPTFVKAFRHGIQSSTQLTGLLQDNQQAIPALLTNLLAITDVAAPRQQQLRKTLVTLPWAVQRNLQVLRYCDKNDPATGKPVQRTCHYDARTGKPQWSAHFALQLPEKPAISDPYNPCIKGYQGTKKYLPSGKPADANGPAERPDTPPNNHARCAASPTDSGTPNVRGSQNAQSPDSGNAGKVALYNPNSGTVAAPDGRGHQLHGRTGPAPPSDARGLTWLLTQPRSSEGG